MSASLCAEEIGLTAWGQARKGMTLFIILAFGALGALAFVETR